MFDLVVSSKLFLELELFLILELYSITQEIELFLMIALHHYTTRAKLLASSYTGAGCCSTLMKILKIHLHVSDPPRSLAPAQGSRSGPTLLRILLCCAAV